MLDRNLEVANAEITIIDPQTYSAVADPSQGSIPHPTSTNTKGNNEFNQERGNRIEFAEGGTAFSEQSTGGEEEKTAEINSLIK